MNTFNRSSLIALAVGVSTTALVLMFTLALALHIDMQRTAAHNTYTDGLTTCADETNAAVSISYTGERAQQWLAGCAAGADIRGTVVHVTIDTAGMYINLR